MGTALSRALTARAVVLLSACAVAALLQTAASIAFAAKKEPLPDAATTDWVEARSARFRVYSNGGAGVARSAARHLERLADTIERTTTGLRADDQRMIRVFVFRDYDSFVPYQIFGNDRISAAAGYHQVGEDLDQIATYAAYDGEWKRLTAHEYLHAVVTRSTGWLPLWLNEGMAEYYSTFEAHDVIATIGRPVVDHMLWLRKHMLIAGNLFEVTQSSPEYNIGQDRVTFYAESWGLVHMLTMDRQDPSRFGRLVTAIGRGTDSKDAVRRIYGPQAPDSLTEELRHYVNRADLHQLEWTFDRPFDEQAVEVRDLDRAESLCLLGELISDLSSKQLPRARSHLEAAWLADSSRAMPAGLLARLAEESGDSATAARWGAALENVRPQDPRALAVVGAPLARRELMRLRPEWPAPGASKEALRARGLLKRALDAQPGVNEWLVPFAFTYLNETGDVSDGIGALIQAREALPRRTEIGGALCALQARAGNLSLAEHLFSDISPGPNRNAWRKYAGALIAAATFEQLPALIRDGRQAEAESLVTQLARRVPEMDVLRSCDQALASMRKGAAPGNGKP